MNNINLNNLSPEELTTLYINTHKLIHEDSNNSKQVFIEENKSEWSKIGESFKLRREYLQITLKKMGELIGCSPSKISKFERGEPIQVAEMFQRSYEMALELKRIEQQREKLKIKDISNPDTLSFEETKNFYEILWLWIGANDNTYDLYEFIQDEVNGDNGMLNDDEYGELFAELFDRHNQDYDGLGNCLDLYKKEYDRRKKEFESYESNVSANELLDIQQYQQKAINKTKGIK